MTKGGEEGEGAAPRRRERVSFFRQGGWMVLANLLAGVCYAAVAAPAGKLLSKDEYSLFTTLLDSLLLLLVPATALQFMVAQMTAGGVDAGRRARATAAMRQLLVAVAILWAVALVVVWMAQERLMGAFKIRDAAGLWLTLLVAFVGLVYAVFAGALQGGQRFSWLGWSQIATAAGRLGGLVLAISVLGRLASSAMVGVLAGFLVAVCLAGWGSREMWRGETGAVPWGPVLRQLLALAAGVGAYSLMLSVDTLTVRAVFDDEQTAFYMAAGRVGRGLVSFTAPLALVLFPKVVRSSATGEPTAALRLALGAMLGTGVAVALGCSLAPGLVLKILFAGNPDFQPAARLVPWFCWCMLPLTAVNALINNLLARSRFLAVPWLLAVAGAYAVTLGRMRESLAGLPIFEAFQRVVQVLGLFSLLMLLITVVFSLRRTGGAGTARRG